MLWSELERIGRFWDPWRDFERMHRTLSNITQATSPDFPAVNVWVSENNAFVTTELPGIEPGDIDISVVDNVLTLRGSRNPDSPKDGGSYHRRERWTGQFSKTINLPFRADASKVKAQYRKGVLSIEVPRVEEDKPKRISITTS